MNFEIGIVGALVCAPVVLYDLAFNKLGVRTIYFAIWTAVNLILAADFLHFAPVSWAAARCQMLSHAGFLIGTIFGNLLGRSHRIAQRRTIPLPPGWFVLALLIFTAIISAACGFRLHGTANILRVAAEDQMNRDMMLQRLEDEMAEGGWVMTALGFGTGLLRIGITILAIWWAQRKQVTYSRTYRYAAALALMIVAYFSLILEAKSIIITNMLQFVGVALLVGESSGGGVFGSWRRLALYGGGLLLIITLAWQINYRLTDQRNRMALTPFGSTCLYLTGGSVAFSYYVAGDPQTRFSDDAGPLGNTLPFLMRQLMKLKGESYAVTQFKPYIHIPYYYNTYTWLYDFYADAGMFGTTLFPMILGCLCTYIACVTRDGGSVFTCFLYGMLYAAVSVSFFNWSLVVTSHYVLLFMTWLACWFHARFVNFGVQRPA